MNSTIAVIDTSFVLEYYLIINEMVQFLERNNRADLLIIVPYVLIRELDKLKVEITL